MILCRFRPVVCCEVGELDGLGVSMAHVQYGNVLKLQVKEKLILVCSEQVTHALNAWLSDQRPGLVY